MLCAGCGTAIANRNYMSCLICRHTYDLICLNISEDQYESFDSDFKNNWTCPSCVCARPKGGNTNTPVRGSDVPLATDDSFNINTIRRSSYRSSGPKTKTDDKVRVMREREVIDELRMLRSEVREVRKQNKEIKSQVSAVSETLGSTLQEYSKKLAGAEANIAELKLTVLNLQKLVASRDQERMRNELEIIGVPEEVNENLCHIVMVASKKIGVDLCERDIDDVIRVGPKSRKGEILHLSNTTSSRPIVIK